MRSDGFEFVVAAFVLIMVAMVVGGFVLFYAAGRRFFPGRPLHQLGLGTVGLALGILGVIAIFYEDVWAPPPRVRLEVPAGFAHPDAILLEDASAGSQLAWRGADLPFLRKSITITLPANGVLRLKSLNGLTGRGDVVVEWSDGAPSHGMSGGPAPSGMGASLYVMYNRGSGTAEAYWGTDTGRARYFREREGRL